MTTWTRHPTVCRFRDDPPGINLRYTDEGHAMDLSMLANYCHEQQNQIRELQWCVAALLDALEARGLLRLVNGQPPRDRHGERADVKP